MLAARARLAVACEQEVAKLHQRAVHAAVRDGGACRVGLALLLSKCVFGGSDKPDYATVPVQRGNLTVTVSATGKLAPTNQVTVGSQLSGLVTRVVVDVNDRVTAGQPLALIAEKATERLVAILRDEETEQPPQAIYVDYSMVERQSTGPAPR